VSGALRLALAGLALLLTSPALAQDNGAAMDAMMKRAVAGARTGTKPAKSLSVKIDGKVKAAAQYTLADLKALPALDIETHYDGQAQQAWKGVPLRALLDKAGIIDEEGAGTALRHLILARGTDGYAVGIAIGEIDPRFEGKNVIIAYEQDGKPLDSLRLIVPGDAHAGRGVRDLAEITVN
jgi:DMSO/TMAO reductase YedYZ molybdopterin-dependent catalytic subunit